MSTSFQLRLDWTTGSYSGDVLHLLEIAENAPLAANTSTTNIVAQPDGYGSVAIGYGYDLVANSASAINDLLAAGANITNQSELSDLLSTLSSPVSKNVVPDDRR